MAEKPPGALGLDILTQIVNVQWEAGLAVEFFDKNGPPEEKEPTA